ncbi:hypothetical protein V499_03371 [Pseudogymnoascus sp. VKM F-103]|uniref:Bud site selection protein 6 n=1 Tax=Pseudogymnoascus verrucosus TaxID=342668 RepID=A0A1B8G8Y5_9PEZI|nr:Bud site selection protein 6 [Pseudogymnoascus verrucosus]KFY77166.1 hypothetical protein V499_03371 [Pseudogymnoascus sp. VKM F-103]OBT92285.1 Bud site selection protein 6 [Pseudogymnoascus verrucosus]
MQAPQPSQRSIQRRSPAADPGPPPSIPARAMSPTSVSQSRVSTTSARTTGTGSSSRRQNGATHGTNSGPPLSQIEKSVTHLLVATKQLLETLTRWSRHEATDTNVSDVYVRLGYEFNIACRAFAAIGVDTSDLGNVPELLREILESTLSQEASPEGLDQYLPKIRDIIITLLHGLKRKQQKLRQKQSKEVSSQNSDTNVPRNTSTSSVASANTGITTLLNEGIDPNYMPDDRMIVDGKVVTKPEVNQVPPRGSSMSTSPQRRGIPQRGLSSRGSMSSDQSSLSSTTMQNMPVLAPFSGDEAALPPRPGSGELTVDAFPPPPPPPPPPKQNALAALQRGGDLERRASRRYSAYHISKHLGAQAPMPMLPPQNSPIPNRGRDLRETMNAVRGRGSTVHSKQLSTSPMINEEASNRVPSRISETTEPSSSQEALGTNADEQTSGAKEPEDKGRKASNDLDWQGSAEANRISGATLQGPPTDALPVFATGLYDAKETGAPPTPVTAARQSPTTYTGPSENREFVPEQSPQPGKELTLFLQYKTRIKKFVMADGYNDLSIARLQLAFIEKFAWNTHNNGVDLPEIYIQDPVSGVRHELEDLADIKDRSVLVLNVEALDEVKRHIDEGLGGLRKMVEGVKTAIDDQKATMQRVSERQQDAAKEITRLSMVAQTPVPLAEPSARGIPPHSPKNEGNKADINELQSLRRNLAVVRQTFSSFQANMESSMSAIRTKASSVSDAAIRAAVPNMKNDSGRSYVNTGKKTLNDDSDKLVGRVDDLQDIVEDLRKDVVLRGVRPLPRQLEGVAKDISIATQELRKMQEFLKRERPIWTKIWEKELETVCNDREELTMQEDLAADLQDDLEKATQTFALVEQATKEQMKDLPGGAPGGRVPLKSLNHVTLADPTVAKEGVLGEVRALQPNHEGRLEAIERAEKLRQKELEGRKGGEFQKELGNFVEGGKLKKAGGFEEVERARKAKDEKTRREVWERQNGITQADADIAPPLPPIPLEGEDELGVQEDQPPVI